MNNSQDQYASLREAPKRRRSDFVSLARWEPIADCLRQELSEFGGLLHLFEAQQQALLGRDAATVLRHGTAIESLARELAERRARRTELVKAFALENNRPAGSTLRSLLGFVDADAQPLLEALIDEVNHLLHRVRRASRHNHTLISQIVALNEEPLRPLRLSLVGKTRSVAGRLAAPPRSNV